MLGLSVKSISYLKNRPKCFAAGTLVHTEEGPRRIEEVRAGQRVWAFDRQQQEWRLCRVLRAFSNVSAGPLVRVVTSDGGGVEGTTGHPVWVVEGEDLANRGQPDHGADEPSGPTPGRWVPLVGLRPGDAVLAREGKAARVVEVGVGGGPQRVYNLEVEGLHCYAVGTAGLLAHNADAPCEVGGAIAGKAASAKGATPANAAAQGAGQAAQAKPSAATGAVVPPAPGTTTPAAKPRGRGRNGKRASQATLAQNGTGAVKEKAELQRLTDEQLKYKGEGQTKTLGELVEERKNLDRIGATGTEKGQVAKTIGEAGAEREMKAKGNQRAFGGGSRGGNTNDSGNREFDGIWTRMEGSGQDQRKVITVVEEKGGKANLTSKKVPDGRGGLMDAQQGSPEYFEDTLKNMAGRPVGSPGQAIAQEILAARRMPDGPNKPVVIYQVVTTKFARDGKTPITTVAKFKL